MSPRRCRTGRSSILPCEVNRLRYLDVLDTVRTAADVHGGVADPGAFRDALGAMTFTLLLGDRPLLTRNHMFDSTLVLEQALEGAPTSDSFVRLITLGDIAVNLDGFPSVVEAMLAALKRRDPGSGRVHTFHFSAWPELSARCPADPQRPDWLPPLTPEARENRAVLRLVLRREARLGRLWSEEAQTKVETIRRLDAAVRSAPPPPKPEPAVGLAQLMDHARQRRLRRRLPWNLLGTSTQDRSLYYRRLAGADDDTRRTTLSFVDALWTRAVAMRLRADDIETTSTDAYVMQGYLRTVQAPMKPCLFVQADDVIEELQTLGWNDVSAFLHTGRQANNADEQLQRLLAARFVALMTTDVRWRRAWARFAVRGGAKLGTHLAGAGADHFARGSGELAEVLLDVLSDRSVEQWEEAVADTVSETKVRHATRRLYGLLQYRTPQ